MLKLPIGSGLCVQLLLEYTACCPQVYARLEVCLPVTNREKKREICSHMLQRCAQAAQPGGPPGQLGLCALEAPALVRRPPAVLCCWEE
jgi:hypothetical protein